MRATLAICAMAVLAGCGPGMQLPAGVMNTGDCEVAGTASIPGTVNLSFQCSASLSQQGPPAAASAMRSSLAAVAAPQPWPIPPAPPPLPPLP
jgi:hypothetical protein